MNTIQQLGDFSIILVKIYSTFETMFTDSTIASSFHVSPDKFNYMTNWGVAPYANEQLKNNIDKGEYVLVSFNESQNHGAQDCQMDLLLRYLGNHDQQVKVRYLVSKFLQRTTNKDLLMEFNKLVDIINLSKIMQDLLDGQSVDLNFRE